MSIQYIDHKRKLAFDRLDLTAVNCIMILKGHTYITFQVSFQRATALFSICAAIQKLRQQAI